MLPQSRASDAETIFFLRLVRDADKLDIWRVFAEYYDKDDAERESAADLVFLMLQDIPMPLSRACRKEACNPSALKTLNDFRIMQLTWVYDLNFRFRSGLLQNRATLSASLRPCLKQITCRALFVLRQYLKEKAKDESFH